MESNLLPALPDVIDVHNIKDSLTEKWLSQETALVTGLFHLTHDGHWQILFASEDCLHILRCTDSEFLSTFQDLTVLTPHNDSKKTVSTILDEILVTKKTVSFICNRFLNGVEQFIRGVLTISSSQNGHLNVYGQISDISEEKIRNARFESLGEEFKSSLKISRRVVYRYQIKGRQAIIAPKVAMREGIPEVIDNFPDWNVKAGFVAPQSIDAWHNIFDAIDRGEKQGSENLLFRIHDKQMLRRYQVDFVNNFDENGKPVFAVIAYKNITDEYTRNYQQILERTGLLKIAQTMYPEILSMNLTQNTYRMIQFFDTTVDVPPEGHLDQILLPRIKSIAPEYQDAFKRQFLVSNQLKAIQEGKRRIQLTYRWQNKNGVWHWLESIVIWQENPYNDDVLTFGVTRNIDEQKAKEELLKQALADSTSKLEGWLYYNSLSSQFFPGLIYVNYDDKRPSPYTVGSLAQELDCPPKELALSTCFRIPKEDQNNLSQAFEASKQNGEKSFQAEYRIEKDNGEIVWVCNQAVYFEDKNKATGYIHFITDITHQQILMEQIRGYMEEKLAENQKIFDVVSQHTNRILCYYDIPNRRARPWSDESCETCRIPHLCLKKFSLDSFNQGDFLYEESRYLAKRLFEDIHDGVPCGEAKLHIKMPDTTERWMQFKYTSFLNDKTPVAAILSFEDVTEHHEHELAYRRHIQMLESNQDNHMMFIESDLTADRIERLSGHSLSEAEKTIQCAHSDFGKLFLEQKFQFEKILESSQYFSRENLIGHYNRGEKLLRSKWKVRFNNKEEQWIDAETVLMEDPYNGHIKAFFRIKDVTEEQEEHLSILHQANYDAMTGLFRKVVGENQIKKYLDKKDEKGGILILLDLDDMKNINDTLGHKQGDLAITGIADTLINHFRENDILIRAGGDEFIVFLPGAGQSVNSVELSLAMLLRKLSGITVGENNEHFLSCSVGCAVEQSGIDTYDSLFKRADMALYHVKRSGKNNFAFYVPEMSKAGYQFKAKPVVSPMIDFAKGDEWQQLLKITSSAYFLVALFNLSKNDSRIINIGHHPQTEFLSDSIENFWENWKKNIHPEDQANTIAMLSKEALLSQYTHGKQQMQHYYRDVSSISQEKVEVKVHFYLTDDKNVCAFLFFQRNIAFEKELELLRLQKILELSSAENIEYICLINVMNKNYSTFSRDSQNSHLIPEIADFDEATRHIRDTLIPQESRETYYKQAFLEHVLQNMREKGGYSYRYTMNDGITREAVFSWYEENQIELLMLVRKVM